MRRAAALLILALLGAGPARAQAVTSSPAPEAVAVTVYRAPGRPADQPLELGWLNGYALVSETRRIRVPAGEGVIRFEGVASGILPQSAIVTGLPEGVAEKNQDAWLLSPAALVDQALGERVTLRRTSRATGRVREEEAEVLTGGDGGVLLRTAAGIEALRCSGLAETLVFPRVPPDLSAKPTLSVRTRSTRGGEALVTLSYLASGFDWQANYVGELSPDGRSLALFAWVTLASTDDTSFRAAEAQAVAGRVNRADDSRGEGARGEPIRLECWPQGTTSDVPLQTFDIEDIVVTGSRIGLAAAPPPPPPAVEEPAPVTAQARQEELGDLKLYRLPERVTIAANSQKQVAMLARPRVRVDRVHRSRVTPGAAGRIATELLLRTRNRAGEGLGIPLPAGGFALFGGVGARRILLGEGSLDDRAVGEDVEIVVGRAQTVIAEQSADEDGRTTLTVSNPGPDSVEYEAELFAGPESRPASASGRVVRDGERWRWRTRIPPGGRATLRYPAR